MQASSPSLCFFPPPPSPLGIDLRKMLRLTRSSASSWVLLMALLVIVLELQFSSPVAAYSRADFPSHFIFGASSSAIQVEGAASEDGRTPSILESHIQTDDEHRYKDITACDEYHKYKEDVKLMVDTGLDAYKFSISWSRLIPNGRGPVNPKAVEYYNNLINELISHGIQPHGMLLHWDLPQALWDDYGGRIGHKIVKDFTAYADVCFREFGDRVLHWTTFNEANMFPIIMCDEASIWSFCTSSNDSYIGAHNLLLAHASAVRLYRTKYQEKQHGHIGVNLNTARFAPQTDAKEDLLAARRVKDFMLGWFMNPLVFGEYPETMKKILGNRLPSLTEQESKLVMGSFDFIAINCYANMYVKDKPNSAKVDNPSYLEDTAAELRYGLDGGQAIVQPILEYFKQDYGNPLIYIYENGYRMLQNTSVNDTPRVEYLNASVKSLLHAIRNGSMIQGYFIWSFLDLFEFYVNDGWAFGLYYVDMNDPDLKRYPKYSAYWYTSFLKGQSTKKEIIQQITNSTVYQNRLVMNQA